jgi:hypothetical protein
MRANYAGVSVRKIAAVRRWLGRRRIMKKLTLKRETIAVLTSANLEYVQGAGGPVLGPVPVRTTFCPVPTNGCTGGPCVVTIGTSGTSVINPSGG